MVPTTYYVLLSTVLFVMGAMGVLVRRNAIVLFMSVELMLNAANLTLVAYARERASTDGQVLVFCWAAMWAMAALKERPRTWTKKSIELPALLCSGQRQ